MVLYEGLGWNCMKDVGRIVMAECQIGQPEGDIVERRRKRVGVLDRAEMKVELFPLVLFYFFTHLFLPIAPPLSLSFLNHLLPAPLPVLQTPPLSVSVLSSY